MPAPISARLVDWLADPDHGVAITGASGWIGGAMAHHAVQAAGRMAPHKLRLFGSRARVVEIAGRSVAVEALQGAPALGPGEWLVLHLAVAGPDRIPDPHAMRAQNHAMLTDLLALAADSQVRRLVCASSGAIYGAAPARQAYSDIKREQEAIAQTWADAHGAPLLIPRIFNVGGPYMTHPGAYALGDFIGQARTGAIEIAARRPVVRSYVHVLDLAAVVFDLALGEAPVLTFDTAGPQPVELAELAAAVGRALDLPRLDIRRPALDPAAGEDRYVGDGAIYTAALARIGGAPAALDEIIRDTAAWLAR